MRRTKLVGIPVVLLITLFGWLVLDSLRAKYRLEAKYALPADTNPRALLDFMRKMDGSVEFSTGLLRSDNVQAVCSAIMSACKYEPDNSPQLTPVEQREVQFYRVKYAGWSIISSLAPQTRETIVTLIEDTKHFLASADAFGLQEQLVAKTTLHVLDGIGHNSEALEFVEWLSGKLPSMPPSPEKEAFALNLKGIATRLALTHNEIEFQSSTLAEASFDIQSLHGKVVLVEFWGTRCQPCLADLPALKRIYQKYHDRGFEIVGVCLNAEPERIRRFVAERELPWIQLCHNHAASMDCNKGLSDRFGIEAVPTTMLIDAAGKVVMQGVRPMDNDPKRDLEKQLEKLLPTR